MLGCSCSNNILAGTFLTLTFNREVAMSSNTHTAKAAQMPNSRGVQFGTMRSTCPFQFKTKKATHNGHDLQRIGGVVIGECNLSARTKTADSKGDDYKNTMEQMLCFFMVSFHSYYASDDHSRLKFAFDNSANLQTKAF
jgi:hypothetical protein